MPLTALDTVKGELIHVSTVCCPIVIVVAVKAHLQLILENYQHIQSTDCFVSYHLHLKVVHKIKCVISKNNITKRLCSVQH